MTVISSALDYMRPRFRVGDEVIVRSLSEILETLDDNGEFEGMPFMPEMVRWCGQRLRVAASAHKTCDGQGDIRRMHNAVHLQQARCDGSAHDGCQQRCRLFFKEAWIRPVDKTASLPQEVDEVDPSDQRLRRLWDRTRDSVNGETVYRCQFTSVVRASEALAPWEPSQYVLDVTSGNRRVTDVIASTLRSFINICQAASRRLPSRLRYRGGQQLPVTRGTLRSTPRGKLKLNVGEPVQIRTLPEIVATLDVNGRNRGLRFGPEESTWCGTSTNVAYKVERIIDETTGRMINLKSDCLVLEDVTCRGKHFRGCPRGGTHYWREAWLKSEADR